MRKLSLILLILISSLASAEESALLISINDYQDDFGPLRYYVTDMEFFALFRWKRPVINRRIFI